MLFRKKVERCCAHCAYSTNLDEEKVLCSKKGVKDRMGKCRRFTYDPCKRVPAKAKAVDFAKYEEYDYSL